MNEKLPRYRWIIVSMTSLGNLLDISFIGMGLTSVLLFTIKESLGLTGVQVGLLASATSFTMWLALFAGMLDESCA